MTLLRPTYEQAKAYAERQRQLPYGSAPTATHNWYRLCQMFARSCPGAAAFGGSANSAWSSIPKEHKFAPDKVKPGMIGYASMVDGNGNRYGAGHAYFIIENGYCYSTDIKRRGMVDICHISAFRDQWGMKILGGIDWTPSGKLGLKTVTPPVITLPVVDLSVVVTAAKFDPLRDTGEVTPGASDDVLLVEKGLLKVGLLESRWIDGSYGTRTRDAYANWQRRTVPGPYDGIPGSVSLNALARKTGLFKVVA